MMALLLRLGLGGIGLKGLATLILAVSGIVLATGLAAKLYLAGMHAERTKILEATIARVKAELAANEIVVHQAEADARTAEADERRLKELIDAFQYDSLCPLTREHIDGVRRIDKGP